MIFNASYISTTMAQFKGCLGIVLFPIYNNGIKKTSCPRSWCYCNFPFFSRRVGSATKSTYIFYIDSVHIVEVMGHSLLYNIIATLLLFYILLIEEYIIILTTIRQMDRRGWNSRTRSKTLQEYS